MWQNPDFGNKWFYAFINKVESAAQHQQAAELAGQILAMKHPQVGGVIIGSMRKEEGLWLQA